MIEHDNLQWLDHTVDIVKRWPQADLVAADTPVCAAVQAWREQTADGAGPGDELFIELLDNLHAHLAHEVMLRKAKTAVEAADFDGIVDGFWDEETIRGFREDGPLTPDDPTPSQD